MPVLPQPWAWRERPSTELPQEIIRYLAVTEVKALGGQIHEARMIEPILSTVIGFVVLVVAYAHVPDDAPVLANLLIAAWLFLFFRLLWLYWEWTRNLIFITPNRIIYAHGIIVRRVAMMPIGKVTDMSYNRSVPGMILGYGQFVVESAGQDQALRVINLVPDPDATYRYLQDTLFGKSVTDVNLVKVDTESAVPVNLVDVHTKRRLPVRLRGRWRSDGDDGGRFWDDDD